MIIRDLWLSQRGSLYLFLLCCAGVLFMGVLWIRYVTADIVMTSALADAYSPDHAWKAQVIETTVEGELVTVITAEVRLTSVRNPMQAMDMVGVDTGGHREDRPRFVWSGDRTLQVTVSDMPAPTIYTREFGGVHIDVREDPAGLIAREAGRKYLEELEREPARRSQQQ